MVLKEQLFYLLRNKYLWILLLGAIVVMGFYVREVKLYEAPRLGATFDEFAWSWLGISLINSKIPTSWSPHPQYKNTKIILNHNAYFRLVTPYLEHPPFFGLVAGGFSKLQGLNNPLKIELYKIRPLSLILGVASIVLIFVYANLLYGKFIGLLSSFIYAIVPTIAIGSRLLQNENFFIPVWIAGLICVCLSIKKNKRILVLIPFFLSIILVLSKIPFMAGGISFIAIYMVNKKYKEALFIFGGVLLGFLIYFLYGIYFDKELFFNLLRLQTQRYDLTFNSIFAVFEKPYLADRFYTDGWIIWGYISLFILMIKNFRKNLYLTIPFLVYFGIFMAGIPDEPGHGWYRYPFYPFIVISIAIFIKDYFAKNYILTFFFLVFVVSSLLQNVVGALFGFSFLLFRGFILVNALVLLPLFFDTSKANLISKYSSYLLLIFTFVLSITACYTFVDF